MISFLCVPLGALMRICYRLTSNYGLALILFTVVTKLLLFPISLWVHANGIKMVRLQPAVYRIQIRFFGDKDRIADEQAALYKKEDYNPFANIVPTALQLFLLIGLIQIIYHPLTYLLQFTAEEIASVLSWAGSVAGIDTTASTVEMLSVHAIQASPQELPAIGGIRIAQIQALQMRFLGFDLSSVPLTEGGRLLLIPLLAGFASVMLCLFQNHLNPLQRSQGKAAQLSTMVFSVGLSLILGFIVPAGVGFYWIWSNLFSIIQQPILNLIYPPNKHIDYDSLEAAKAELASYTSVGKEKRSHDEISREKSDYKRFFSIGRKHLVFYSEGSGFYKYFDEVIRYITENSKITIHYVTSDPNDQIFEISKSIPQIQPYYIGEKKLITLFMRLEADVVVMTMSDLGNYHYKRSYLDPNIEYVYIFHYPLSTHMVLHTGALSHYDTILCVGEFQFEEIRQTEKIYGIPEQKLIACGYGQLEKLYYAWSNQKQPIRNKAKVLIAPSWQPDNILDSCIDNILNELLGKGYEIVVRPHPEYVKRYRTRMNAIVNRYADRVGDELSFELDFSGNESIFNSDVVVSDWSGTAYEFVFVTERPCVFIDTPMKVNNPEYTRITVEPLELSLRNKVGIHIKPDQITGLSNRIELLLHDESYGSTIRDLRSKLFSNFGHSGEVGGEYLIDSIRDKIEKRKAKEMNSTGGKHS